MKVVQFSKRQLEPSTQRSRAAPHRQWPQYKGPPHHKQVKRRVSVLPTVIVCTAVLGFVGLEVGPPLVGCNVKANISFNTREKIYHVPGQEYYWQTRINWLQGERWFCSEADALRAGWRKSRV